VVLRSAVWGDVDRGGRRSRVGEAALKAPLSRTRTSHSLRRQEAKRDSPAGPARAMDARANSRTARRRAARGAGAGLRPTTTPGWRTRSLSGVASFRRNPACPGRQGRHRQCSSRSKVSGIRVRTRWSPVRGRCAHRLDAVHPGHPHVHEQHVRLSPPGQCHRLVPVRGLAHHRDVRRQASCTRSPSRTKGPGRRRYHSIVTRPPGQKGGGGPPLDHPILVLAPPELPPMGSTRARRSGETRPPSHACPR